MATRKIVSGNSSPPLVPIWRDIPLVLLWLAGVVLLFLCATGDLWFDEIWSLSVALSLPGWSDIFQFRHDNNHILNTLFLRLAGVQSHLMIYRSLTLACGTASLAIMAGVARSLWGRREAMLAPALGPPPIRWSCISRKPVDTPGPSCAAWPPSGRCGL